MEMRWASTKLKVLCLEVLVEGSEERVTPFYERSPPVVLTEFEESQFWTLGEAVQAYWVIDGAGGPEVEDTRGRSSL